MVPQSPQRLKSLTAVPLCCSSDFCCTFKRRHLAADLLGQCSAWACAALRTGICGNCLGFWGKSTRCPLECTQLVCIPPSAHCSPPMCLCLGRALAAALFPCLD